MICSAEQTTEYLPYFDKCQNYHWHWWTVTNNIHSICANINTSCQLRSWSSLPIITPILVHVSAGIDLSTFQSDYKDSSGWDIVNVTAQRKIMPSEKEDPNFIVLTFDINMKRKMVFSTYILTLPCVFLACLTLVVFWLPPDRPDRTMLGKCFFKPQSLYLDIVVFALYKMYFTTNIPAACDVKSTYTQAMFTWLMGHWINVLSTWLAHWDRIV